MPLKLEIKRKLSARSDRVKCVDLHPNEPWMLAALYNGNVHIWNIESNQLIKSFEVCQPPVRAARFIERKNWIVTGSDDMQIRVFNYNTLERVHIFEGHSDYIRAIVVHSTQPYILTSSDDNLIKLWNWEKNWQCAQVYEGHLHYVMCLSINPKDNNTFASCSLDKTIKVWNLGSPHANFTLEGHDKGVNCVDYYSGGDKPYLVSGADDRLVKIWDYQTKTCVQTLEGHAQNLSCVSFHPEFPLIITGSEDSTVRLWHANTYRLESTLNYGLERVWTIGCLKGSNAVALGYDEGSIVIKLGREEPAMSMDSSGKIVWARHAELQQANLKTISADETIEDGERLPLNTKDMGACEIYPQSISHSANGRFVAAVGDGEYIVYTAMALRNKSFGSAQEFVWSTADASMYAIRDGTTTVKVFKNFKEQRSFKPEFGAEQIFGGHLLGVRSVSGLAFYDWETCELVRRIEIAPSALHWNESGRLVAIVTEDTVFLLRYDASARDNKDECTEDGFEAAFDLITNGEIEERVKTALWVGDCFLFTNNANRLQYYVGGELVTIAHMDRQMYLLGYLPKENRVYLGDRELNIVSYALLLAVLEYQTAVMREDFVAADRILPTIPRDQRTRVAHFLEKQGFPHQALAVSTDPDHRFELACQLGDLKIGYQLALDADSRERWQQLADVATRQSEFGLAQECMARAKDHGSLLLLASCTGNASMLQRLAAEAGAEASTNVAFLARFLLGDLEACFELLLQEGRLPEAAFFARSYLPSRINEAVQLWKEHLTNEKGHEKIAQSLADPEQYDNLFEGHSAALAAESYLRRRRGADLERSASDWDASLMPAARDPLAEMEEGGASSQEARVRSSARDSPPPPPRSDVNGGPPKAALGSGSDGGGGGVGGGGGIEDFERELERDLEDLELGRDSPHRSSSGGAGAGGGGGDEDDLDLDDDFEDFA